MKRVSWGVLRDADGRGFRPALISDGEQPEGEEPAVAMMGIVFPTRASCEGFIRDRLTGRGRLVDTSDSRHSRSVGPCPLCRRTCLCVT